MTNFKHHRTMYTIIISLLFTQLILINLLLYSQASKTRNPTMPKIVKECEKFGQFEYKDLMYLCSKKPPPL